MAGTL